MSEQPTRRVVIVGGGTAGWMTAAAFSRFLGSAWTVTLVESDEIGAIGVGEATIPQIRLFNQGLGLDEDAFLRATGGTFKLGIEFVDWLEPGSRYMHAFGAVGRDLGLSPFHHFWLRARASGHAEPLSAYALNEQAALAGRMARVEPAPGSPSAPMPYAFHFDATLYARFLRAYAEPRGVQRIEGRITGVDQAVGRVLGLQLQDGRRVEGDLFIDCSGFRALVVGEALGCDFEDWSHWLPCDRAVAVPSRNPARLAPFTRSSAEAAGWRWRIPLQHRTGNGHVFCSRHMSEDEATARLLAGLDGEALAEPRTIRIATGIRRRMWSGNAIAVGLSAGFMEPLESTSIHLIQAAIARILRLLPSDPAGDLTALADAYNQQSAFEWERIRDFIILHYIATRRSEPFWRERRGTPPPDTLAEKIALFRAHGRIFREHEELFTEVGWLQVMIGQGVDPSAWSPLADAISDKDLTEFLSLIRQVNQRDVARMASHEDFIAGHCAMPGGVAA